MNILFPIETLSREFDYKLILAQEIVATFPEVNVFIGSVAAIHDLQPFFENGLYIGKTVFTSTHKKLNLDRHESFKKRGIDFIYFHEEGAIWYGDYDEWKYQMKCQYDLDILDSEDSVCLWGETQKVIDEERNSNEVALRVTGCPRLDLNKLYPEIYDKDVKELKEKFGDFILINGNYACNHGEGFQGSFDATYVASGLKKIEEHMEWFMPWYINEKTRLLKMIELVVIASQRHPGLNFVYRPHPSENMDAYAEYFSPYDNIHIVREGAVNPFILAAKGVVHEGCTTGLESVTAGKPVINYKVSNLDYNIYLTSLAGSSANSLAEAVALIDSIVTNELNSSSIKFGKKAEDLLWNLTANDSFQRFLEVIYEKIEGKKFDASEMPSSQDIFKWYTKRSIKLKASKLKNTLTRNKKKLDRDYYLMNKFPGIDDTELNTKLNQLNMKSNKEVKCHFYNPELIKFFAH